MSWKEPSLRRAVLIVVTWAAATFFGLAFAELTKVGPVLLALSYGHGIHVGDLVAFAAAYSAAVLADPVGPPRVGT